MAGTDSLGVVDANSTLAVELLDLFSTYAAQRGTVALPDVAKDFARGRLEQAFGAPSFEIEWVSL